MLQLAGSWGKAWPHGPDTETVRRILQALKSQADSMSEQITHYERKLLSCGNVEEAARHILQAAVKVVQGSKGGADDKHKPPGDRPTEGVRERKGSHRLLQLGIKEGS